MTVAFNSLPEGRLDRIAEQTQPSGGGLGRSGVQAHDTFESGVKSKVSRTWNPRHRERRQNFIPVVESGQPSDADIVASSRR
jgi:hypothetical protein